MYISESLQMIPCTAKAEDPDESERLSSDF